MEIWKDIAEYEGLYQVSNKGRVKSLERKVWNSGNQSYQTIKEKILKPCKNSDGYLLLNLYKDGQRRPYFIHRLVADTFIPNPNEYKEVNHIDENKENNNVSNLEWVTRKENINHGTRNERIAKTLTNRKDRSKPVVGTHKETGLVVKYPSMHEASRQLGIKASNISACCRGYKKHSHAGGYTWSFVEGGDNK